MRLWLSLAIEAVVEAPSPFETLSLLRGRRRTIWGRKFPYIYLIKWLLKCLFWREIKNFLLIAHVVYLLLFVCSFLSNSNDKQNLRLKFSSVFQNCLDLRGIFARRFWNLSEKNITSIILKNIYVSCLLKWPNSFHQKMSPNLDHFCDQKFSVKFKQ